eukprot:scaffold248764_cov43-Prasinocladus_malaysianus.AAC.5
MRNSCRPLGPNHPPSCEPAIDDLPPPGEFKSTTQHFGVLTAHHQSGRAHQGWPAPEARPHTTSHNAI